jgi:hypothetical protein
MSTVAHNNHPTVKHFPQFKGMVKVRCFHYSKVVKKWIIPLKTVFIVSKSYLACYNFGLCNVLVVISAFLRWWVLGHKDMMIISSDNACGLRGGAMHWMCPHTHTQSNRSTWNMPTQPEHTPCRPCNHFKPAGSGAPAVWATVHLAPPFWLWKV